MSENVHERIVVTIDPDLEDLAEGYIGNRRRDVEALRTALMKEDYETARILGHSMKGSGGGYGFDRITELGAAIEQAAKASDYPLLYSLIKDLVGYLDRLDITCG